MDDVIRRTYDAERERTLEKLYESAPYMRADLVPAVRAPAPVVRAAPADKSGITAGGAAIIKEMLDELWAEIAVLRQEVAELRSRVDPPIEKRLQEIEAKLATAAPAIRRVV